MAMLLPDSVESAITIEFGELEAAEMVISAKVDDRAKLKIKILVIAFI